MKNIKIESLTLRNFKKVKELTVNFYDRTQINGSNGSGKTTVFDAYVWLLFGKNSVNENDFSIKTLDFNNRVIEKLEHEVEGVFNVDGEKMTFKRVYLEKWTTKRGNDFEELTGHETKFFIDDVPQSKSDYESRVKELISESISKIISNPDYFNNQIKWQDRRIILEDMAGEITDAVILEGLSSDVDTSLIIELLESGKNFEDEKKKASVQKKKLKDELKLIPSRIDEVDRMKPEAQDFEAFKIELDKAKEELEGVNESIENENKAFDLQKNNVLDLQNKRFKKTEELSQLERNQSINDNRGELDLKTLSDKRSELNELKNKENSIKFKIDKNTNSINSLKSQNNTLREEWKKANSETGPVISEGQTACPTCKRELENAEEIKANLESDFNIKRIKTLTENETKGKANAESIKELERQNEEFNTEIEKLSTIEIEKEISELEQKAKAPRVKLEPTQEMIELRKEIDSIVIPEILKTDKSEAKIKANAIQEQIDALKTKLSDKEIINKADQRIEELTEQKRKLSQEIATFEKIEFQIEAFMKAKTSLIESRVNEKFSLVKFKMFEQQINGGEAPICVCMVDGVPFKDLNTASQINAGLDVINSLQYHYQIFAPVFVDHRESITTLIDLNCQVISLKVDETAQELQILNV